jgi:hypothetical protein
MLEGVRGLIEQGGGALMLSHDPSRSPDDSWIVAIEWGREENDSPMAGAAAYGLGSTPTDALEKALKEAGV